jgi:hypothetical protein
MALRRFVIERDIPEIGTFEREERRNRTRVRFYRETHSIKICARNPINYRASAHVSPRNARRFSSAALSDAQAQNRQRGALGPP